MSLPSSPPQTQVNPSTKKCHSKKVFQVRLLCSSTHQEKQEDFLKRKCLPPQCTLSLIEYSDHLFFYFLLPSNYLFSNSLKHVSIRKTHIRISTLERLSYYFISSTSRIPAHPITRRRTSVGYSSRITCVQYQKFDGILSTPAAAAFLLLSHAPGSTETLCDCSRRLISLILEAHSEH